MSIQRLNAVPRLAPTPVARPVAAARPAATVRAAAAPAPAQAPSGLLATLEHAAKAVADWALTPYRALAGNYGAKLFVRPDAHSTEGDAPSQWKIPYETVHFQAKDGTPLKGWYMPADKPTDKTIVLAHGHGGQMSDVLWRWAPWLHKAGYNLMAFDFRNSGGSGGSKTTMGFDERQDLDAALTVAQQKGGKHLAVMGLSMGAATALEQAADDKRIEAIVSDCSFDTVEHAVASRVVHNTFDLGPFKGLHFPLPAQVTKGVVAASAKLAGHPEGAKDSLTSVSPLAAIKKLQDRPIFLIHGAADDETLPSNSVALAKADPNAELWLVPGAKHGESYSVAKDQYKAKVLDFLQRSF